MASKKVDKLNEAQENLKNALELYHQKKIDNRLAILTVAKSFEILLEYTWKELKRKIEDEGLEARSPKEAIRQAAVLGIIANPEFWIECINARNDSVHDYFSIPEKDYIALAKKAITLVLEIEKAIGS